jgi:hypothetical protein
MYTRGVAALVLAVSVVPAGAEPMNAQEARRFVVGKLFSYSCFEGTRGAGRIHSDGSVAGTIQLRGSGPVYRVRLPANTLREKGESVCASVRGLPFDPCFTLNKTSHHSFRGSIYGLSFAYCEFHRSSQRIDVERKPLQAVDLPLRAAIDGR